jgi:transposase-like protein
LDYQKALSEGINEYLDDARRVMLEALMQAEVQHRLGDFHQRVDGRSMHRWGYEKGTAMVSGAKVEVNRPRIRVLRQLGEQGGEQHLDTYKAMNRTELMDGPLLASILSGVSARRYASICYRGLMVKGVSKSAISKRAIAASKSTIDEFLNRQLSGLSLVVLLFDGIHVAHKQMIVCVGIDRNGRKHVLGLRLGATENEIVCRDLICEMVERGLETETPYLFVIDGSRALARAIKTVFGHNTQIQRCQEHKIRNVQAYVPAKYRKSIRSKMQAAYAQPTEKAALNRLTKIRSELSLISENAVNALTEGMLETLTVHRLEIKGDLRKALRTTNIMESMFSSVRRYMGRVTYFRDDSHIERWMIRSLVETEKHLRTVPGHRQLASLREILNKRR